MTKNNDRTKHEAGNSGSRPFSPIYHNFQNLLDNNQGVFRLFRKAKNPGMYQAVWQSRQAEVDTYKERLLQSEKLLSAKEREKLDIEINFHKSEATWFEQHNEQRKTIELLQETLKNANTKIAHQNDDKLKAKDNYEREKMALKKDLLEQRQETEKFRILARSMERVIKMNGHKDGRYENEISKLEAHLNLSQHALIKLDDEYEKSQVDLQNQQNRIKELENKLNESEHYNKEFKRINHRMENELFRVTNELENMQSFITH